MVRVFIFGALDHGLLKSVLLFLFLMASAAWANCDGDLLLHAVATHPDEDTPRLAYADWLDEQGGEIQVARAEFIRLQCTLAGRTVEKGKRRTARERMKALLAQYGAVWFPLLENMAEWEFGLGVTPPVYLSVKRRGSQEVPRLKGSVSSVSIDRGFIHEVRVGARQFVTLLPEPQEPRGFFSRLLGGRPEPRPPLEVFRVDAVNALLTESGPIPRLVVDGIRSNLVAFLTANQLSTLDSLALGFNRLDARDADAIAAAPHLANLHSLTLIENNLGNEGVAALAASPYLGKLHQLELSRNGVGPAGIRALVTTDRLASLKELHLGDNPVGDAGAALLADWPRLRDFESLYLSDSEIGDEGWGRILNSRFLSESTFLSGYGGRAWRITDLKRYDIPFWPPSEDDD